MSGSPSEGTRYFRGSGGYLAVARICGQRDIPSSGGFSTEELTMASDGVAAMKSGQPGGGCTAGTDHDRDVPEVDLLSPLAIRGARDSRGARLLAA
jgi:hypothetical protein